MLVGELERPFSYLEGNAEKYINFSVLIVKEIIRIDKSRTEITKTISYRLQFIDSAHYQILLIILLKEFIRLNKNTDIMIKAVKLAELNTKIATAFLNIQTLKIF